MLATKQGTSALYPFPQEDLTKAELLDMPRRIRVPAEQGDISPKIAEFLATHEDIPSPCLVVDVDIVEYNYTALQASLPQAAVYYAVKANPAPEILARLVSLGSSFDTASVPEIDMCLRAGATPDRLSYGNTIKKKADIEAAYQRGIRMFAFDSIAELEKIAEVAPNTRVYCRILVESEGAEWPLSRKFGCCPTMAAELLVKAKELGLEPYGISFHVGSQQTNLGQWDAALNRVATLFSQLAEKGIELSMVNIGGGFPSRYRVGVQPVAAYGQAVMTAMTKAFGDKIPHIIAEPGRSLVGDAGVIQAEVVLVSKKDEADEKRWVFLDIGKFSGLAETMDEAIKYRIISRHEGKDVGPVVLAGPTCDSADILYEKTDYDMPLDLVAGNKVLILSTGAYTTTYSAVGFNGFAPLASICI